MAASSTSHVTHASSPVDVAQYNQMLVQQQHQHALYRQSQVMQPQVRVPRLVGRNVGRQDASVNSEWVAQQRHQHDKLREDLTARSTPMRKLACVDLPGWSSTQSSC